MQGSLFYALNADRHEAFLASTDTFLVPWIDRKFGGIAARGPLEIGTRKELEFWKVPASPVSLQGPDISSKALPNAGSDVYEISVRSLRNARSLMVKANPNVEILGIQSVHFNEPRQLRILLFEGLNDGELKFNVKIPPQKSVDLIISDATRGWPEDIVQQKEVPENFVVAPILHFFSGSTLVTRKISLP